MPAAARTPDQAAAADRVEKARKAVRSLSDSELEMVDSAQLSKGEFVSELKSSQVAGIMKSSKFTSSQKESLRNKRAEPLLDALDTSRGTHAPNPGLVKDMITKKLNAKDVAGLVSTEVQFSDPFSTPPGAVVTRSILTHPEIMELYTPNLLKRMADELTPDDISNIKLAIEDAGTAPTATRKMTELATWLNTPDGNYFS